MSSDSSPANLPESGSGTPTPPAAATECPLNERCPACGHGQSTPVSHGAAAEAVDGLDYLRCNNCQAAFRKSVSRADQRGCAIAGGVLVLVGVGLWLWPGWLWFPIALGVLGVLVAGEAILSLNKPLQPGTIVELVREEERRPSFAVPPATESDNAKHTAHFAPPPPRLNEWIAAQAAQDRPVVRFLQRGVGALVALVGGCMVLCAGGFVMRNFNRSSSSPDPFGDLDLGQLCLVSLGFMIVGLIGNWLSSVGKGLKGLSSPAWKLLMESRRPPILLLRSFDDDQHRLWTGGTLERKFDSRHHASTLEDAIVEVFNPVGVTVALSPPGERLPPSGAARARLSNAEWQEWVHEFLGWSQRIIMVMGNVDRHPALAWELQTIFATCPPEKLLLILPPNADEADVKARWLSYRQFLQGRIPEYRPDAVLLRYTAAGNTLVTTTERFRSLGSEEKRKVFLAVLTAHANWKRPDAKIEGLATVTELVECSIAPPETLVRPLDEPSEPAPTPPAVETIEARPPARIVVCPHCRVLVQVRDGECPSCRKQISDDHPPAAGL